MTELATVTRRLLELVASAVRDGAIASDYSKAIEGELGRVSAVREDETGREL